MNFLQRLFFGCISGIAEFLPISSLAHQKIIMNLFGVDAIHPLQSLFVHVGLIFAVLVGCGSTVEQLRRGYQSQKTHRRSLKSGNSVLELQFVRNAILPLLLTAFILYQCINIDSSLLWVAVFSLLNFVIMFAETRMMRGNKSEQSVSILDSIIIGAAGAFSVLPGISRIGAMQAAATACGIDRQKSLNWVIILSIPMLVFFSIVDVFGLVTLGAGSFASAIVPSLFSGLCAFICGYFSISLLKSIFSHNDRTGFAFYSLGVALFSLILYLMVV